MKAVAAVDLGATSGRVILGYVSHNELRMRHIARFPNQPVSLHEGTGHDGAPRSGLHWNILELYRSLTAGLASAVRDEPNIASIGVDSWAVDYALLRDGRMLGTPYHYRDERTAVGVQAVHSRMDAAELYGRNGLQHLPFNTLFQLAADRAAGTLELADQAMLIPDLIGYWLTGVAATEITNASTTGLLDPRSRTWDTALFTSLDLPAGLFPGLIEPGENLGTLLPSVAAEIGAPTSLAVSMVGSHDTASAIVAVPAADSDFAYISSGTWSLVGVETSSPVISPESLAANFTNEGGVDGRIRFLKNVSGLWLLSEAVRSWERSSGTPIELNALLAEAAAVSGPVSVFDAADDRFIPPGDMATRIAEWCTERGLAPPQSKAEVTRSILESLAAAYSATISTAEELANTRISTIHIVGGGSQNALLCQLTADRTGRTVLAGPVEATAIGNILVQARAAGILTGSIESMRSIVAAAFEPVRYTPGTR
ncbi:MAG: rhamnulokinase [Glaciihabitans sp.]|nr:rhamnulokinase [Glaciihabitans sp.]